VAVVHRLGLVPLGEGSVVIAVSASHRAEAFEACRYIIDKLKERVPFWKKEEFEDGTSAWSQSTHGDVL
jgi:molybdopterin synthase catalytic subunit